MTPLDGITVAELVRLNLGAGDNPVPGYTNLDGRRGESIYSLDYPDESVDEIRASNVLEHFGFREVPQVLADWVRALKPGGTMKIAVPDFAKLAAEYQRGRNVQPFVMGGQTHELDFHKTLFDSETLAGVMRAAGLRDIHRFEADADDCSRYPISLNLAGTKRRPLTPQDVRDLNVGAVISAPRLGFMDNFFSCYQSLGPLGIEVQKQTGAYWGQCLERGITDWVDAGKRWILTMDYDSVWARETLEDLLELARDNPEADAIAPLQAHRSKDRPLMVMNGPEDDPVTSAPVSAFMGDLTRIWGAHFGLTLLRVEALEDVPHPWFHGRPNEAGLWETDRIDDDVAFWEKWHRHGKSLYLANHVVVGHCELMVRWPDENLKTMYQHPTEFWQQGPPGSVWK